MKSIKAVLSALTALLLAAVVLVPALQILMREAFRLPFIGAEELTRFLLICLVFTGFPLVVGAGENIVMGEFKAALPDGIRRGLDRLIGISAIGVSAFVAYVAYQTIFKNLNNATPTLQIPFWLFLGAAFLGFAGAALVHFVQLFRPPRRDTNFPL